MLMLLRTHPNSSPIFLDHFYDVWGVNTSTLPQTTSNLNPWDAWDTHPPQWNAPAASARYPVPAFWRTVPQFTQLGMRHCISVLLVDVHATLPHVEHVHHYLQQGSFSKLYPRGHSIIVSWHHQSSLHLKWLRRTWWFGPDGLKVAL